MMSKRKQRSLGKQHSGKLDKRLSPKSEAENEGQFKWSFIHADCSYIDHENKLHWNMSPADMQCFLKGLEHCMQLTWSGLATDTVADGHKRLKNISVNSFSSFARKRLNELDSTLLGFVEDPDELTRLAFSSVVRLWGYRIDDVFYILWYDREHKVCPSSKRHT